MRVAVFIAIWVASTTLALIWGGKTERFGAVISIWLYAGTAVVRLLPMPSYSVVAPADLAVDMLALCGCVMLVVRSERYWTIWFCAAQLVAICGHLVRALMPGEARLAYAIMIRAPSYIQCASIIVGTLVHHFALTDRIRAKFSRA